MKTKTNNNATFNWINNILNYVEMTERRNLAMSDYGSDEFHVDPSRHCRGKRAYNERQKVWGWGYESYDE